MCDFDITNLSKIDAAIIWFRLPSSGVILEYCIKNVDAITSLMLSPLCSKKNPLKESAHSSDLLVNSSDSVIVVLTP